MRILHFHLYLRLELGGVVRSVIDLAGALGEAGHEVTVLTADGEGAPASWSRGDATSGSPSEPRIATMPGPTLPGRTFARAARRVAAECLAEADIVHFHGMWGPYNDQIASVARRVGTPYVVSVHGMLDDWSVAQRQWRKRVYMALVARRMIRGAAAVHCTAEAELDQAARWFDRARGVVIPLVFDIAPFRTLPGPDAARTVVPEWWPDRPMVLFLSRLHYKKGVEMMLDVAARWRAAGRDALFVIAGRGDAPYEQAIDARIAELELTESVVRPGFVSGVEKIALYQAADVFLLPTSQENFGFVLFEALAAGTPLVTTRGVDTWPELERSGGAVIVDGTAAAIDETIASLMDDPDRRAIMGAAGRAWVLEHLDPERVVQRFVGMYERAASTT